MPPTKLKKKSCHGFWAKPINPTATANVARPASMARRMPSRPKRMPAGTSPSSVPRASAASTRPTTPYETSKERA